LAGSSTPTPSATKRQPYRNIGIAYEYIEQIEAYGPGGHPVSNLGLWRTCVEADDEGTARMLLETQTDFAVVDPEADLSAYQTIVLTGAAGLSAAQATQLNAYVAGDGGLLVLGESALDGAKTRFLLDVGATYLGPATYDVDYTVPGEALSRGRVSSPFLNYEAALRARAAEGTEVLATIREPYFSRTYARFCSHLNTPYRAEEAAHPGALRKGKVVFLPHRLGKIYFDHGARLHRDLFVNALRLIYATPTVQTEMPSAGRISLLHQPDKGRYVAHLLYGPPQQRGRCLVIEDLVPLYSVPLEIRVPEAIQRAYLVPGGDALQMERAGDVVRVIVPRVQCHQAIVFAY